MNNIPRVVIALLVISGVLTIALGEPLYRSGRWGLNGDETMIWLGRSGWRSFDYHEVTLFMVANLLAGLIIYYKKDTK